MSQNDAKSGFFCDLTALDKGEQLRRRELAEAVAGAVRKLVELPNGFGLTLDPRKMTAQALREWVALEGRCCPFLSFAIREEPLQAVLIVELTGAEGIKEFLRAEFKR